MAVVHVEIRDRVGILTLDDPERRNCLSSEMLEGLTAGLARLADAKVRSAILRAPPGASVWSAGLDVRSLPEPGRDPLDYQDPLEQVIRQVEHFPAPVIAMVEGGVWGGACDLTFVCDLAIGCETASFAITPGKLGVPYNCSGILHFLNLVGPRVAREMFFTAEPIEAERAVAVGILNRLVPKGELESFTLAMAGQIAENSPLAVGGDQGAAQDPGAQPPGLPGDLRADPGAAPLRLRERRLRRGEEGLPGEAQARLHGRRGIGGPAPVSREKCLRVNKRWAPPTDIFRRGGTRAPGGPPARPSAPARRAAADRAA
jgi:methylmalonyl-CoA decarboxylase